MDTSQHYAIILAISHYPGLSHLKGTAGDGAAFRDWLIASDGGRVPAANIQLLSSRDVDATLPPDQAQPTVATFKQALNKWLMPEPSRRWVPRVGERLYLFMAGHGFTSGTRDDDPGLLTADAQRGDMNHIPGRQYADRIVNAGFFDEVVLVMDCCQDQSYASQLQPLTWSPPEEFSSDKVKCLRAFGAHRGRKAFELELDGVWRGIFSYSLIQALRTGMPDQEGWVSGSAIKVALQGYWTTTFRDYGRTPPVYLPGGEDILMYQRQLADPTELDCRLMAAPEPQLELGDAANTLPLDRAPPKGATPVSLSALFDRMPDGFVVKQLPGRLGPAADRPGLSLPVNKLDQGKLAWLPAGLFSVETPGQDPDISFEVGGSVAQPPDELVLTPVPALRVGRQPVQPRRVVIRADTPAAIVTLTDHTHHPVAVESGRIELDLLPGLYKAQANLGADVVSQIFRVTRDPVTVLLDGLAVESAAPVQGTSTCREYHNGPAESIVLRDSPDPMHGFVLMGATRAAKWASVMVFLRIADHRLGAELPSPPPWTGMHVVRLGAGDEPTSFALDLVGSQEGFAAGIKAVEPGTYALHCPVTGAEEDVHGLAIPAIAGWRTEVYLDCMPDAAGESGRLRPDLVGASVHLVPTRGGTILSSELGLATERARHQLAAGLPVDAVTPEQARKSPMLAIYAALSLWRHTDKPRTNARKRILEHLELIPSEIRHGLLDLVLLARACGDSPALGPQMFKLPLLSASWDISSSLPPDQQIDPTARWLIGQWRAGGLFTVWRRPRLPFPWRGAEATQATPWLTSYDSLLQIGHAEMQQFVARTRSVRLLDQLRRLRRDSQLLKVVRPWYSPYQQALRRWLLEEAEEVKIASAAVQLGAVYGLTREWCKVEAAAIRGI